MNPKPTVRVVPFQPHCFAFGGFEVQMIAAMESARAAGANIAPLDFWRREADYDILHLWGLEVQHVNTVKWAHIAGKRIVLSALVSYPSWKSLLRHLASSMFGSTRFRRAMLSKIDCITVVNEAQARFLVKIVGYPAAQVVVIPNQVDDIFFRNESEPGVALDANESYVLCSGNICRRKNQLSLIAACKKIGVPLLLVGKVLTGEEEYGSAVANAMAGNIGFRWIRGLAPGSEELAAAYRRAAVFALPSFLEQQPISALEAAAAGKPLVLANRPYAKQEYYEGAVLCDPRSVNSIAGALRTALDHPAEHCPRRSIIEQCRSAKVGAAYLAVYQSVAHSNAP